MKDKHIDDITMSLYLGGGLSLRKDLVKWLQSHLEECESCAKKLEVQLNEMADKQEIKDSKEPNVGSNVLHRIAALLSLPLKDPSCWDRLKELCNQLIDTLSEFEALPLHSKNKQRLSLLTTGYMYTGPSAKKESAKNVEEKSWQRQEFGEKMLLLLEILGDDTLPISKRMALLEGLLLYADQKAEEFKRHSSFPQTRKLNEGNDGNAT